MENLDFSFNKISNDFYEIDGKDVIVIDETVNKAPFVSVTMITYNHGEFIEDAIRGVLMQKTSFYFNLVIGDDNSNDKTREIILKYQKLFPDIIILKLPQSNLGVNVNSLSNNLFCTGKYVAICEGDDYWIDENKLEIQSLFLENNHDYVFCFHNALTLYDNNSSKPKNFVQIESDSEFNLDFFIERNIVPTASVVYSKEFASNLPIWFNNVVYGDYAIYLYILYKSKRKSYYFSKTMSVYRVHNQGVFSRLNNADGELSKNYHLLELYFFFYKYVFTGKYKLLLKNIISFWQISLLFLLIKQQHYIKFLSSLINLFFFNPRYIFKKIISRIVKFINLNILFVCIWKF
jgi:glycosyltransferase involved in cell wall biosynthesis